VKTTAAVVSCPARPTPPRPGGHSRWNVMLMDVAPHELNASLACIQQYHAAALRGSKPVPVITTWLSDQSGGGRDPGITGDRHRCRIDRNIVKGGVAERSCSRCSQPTHIHVSAPC